MLTADASAPGGAAPFAATRAANLTVLVDGIVRCKAFLQMAGWRNQKIGDVGQSLVMAELTRAGFLVGSLSPDPGEDLWAEVDGRQAIAEGRFPLRALFQVKATEDIADVCVLDLDVDDLKRWAAQALPVFVIGVSTTANTFFAKSIDQIITDDLLGRDPFELKAKTARARVDPSADVGASTQSQGDIRK
jgi:hypothetical protein